MSSTLYVNVYHAGVGNHLFTIASAYGIARKYNKQLVVINRGNCIMDPHSKSRHEWLYDKLQLAKNAPRETRQVSEHPTRCCSTDPNVIREIETHQNDTIVLNGYLQCEAYFKEYYDDICNLFEIPRHLTKPYETFDTDSYFMHIRLGDYLSKHGKPVHFIDLSKYYVTCLNSLHNKLAKIYVFSNECLKKCIEIYPILQTITNRMVFIDEPDQLTTLRLMTMCSLGGICANSSFSWWGAYLNKNPNKEVYMPSRWTNNVSIQNDIPFSNALVISV